MNRSSDLWIVSEPTSVELGGDIFAVHRGYQGARRRSPMKRRAAVNRSCSGARTGMAHEVFFIV